MERGRGDEEAGGGASPVGGSKGPQPLASPNVLHWVGCLLAPGSWYIARSDVINGALAGVIGGTRAKAGQNVTGWGVSQDDAEAVRWHRLAAEQGHANAQASLGATYFVGNGVPQDYVQAHKWLTWQPQDVQVNRRRAPVL